MSEPLPEAPGPTPPILTNSPLHSLFLSPDLLFLQTHQVLSLSWTSMCAVHGLCICFPSCLCLQLSGRCSYLPEPCLDATTSFVAWVKAPGREYRTCLLPFQVSPWKAVGAWCAPILCTEPVHSRCLNSICCTHERLQFLTFFFLYSILLYAMPHPNPNPSLSLPLPITGK